MCDFDKRPKVNDFDWSFLFCGCIILSRFWQLFMDLLDVSRQITLLSKMLIAKITFEWLHTTMLAEVIPQITWFFKYLVAVFKQALKVQFGSLRHWIMHLRDFKPRVWHVVKVFEWTWSALQRNLLFEIFSYISILIGYFLQFIIFIFFIGKFNRTLANETLFFLIWFRRTIGALQILDRLPLFMSRIFLTLLVVFVQFTRISLRLHLNFLQWFNYLW